MTISEQRTMLTNLMGLDLDNVLSESPSNANLDSQINYAQREVSKFVRLFYPKITLTLVAGTAIYDIQDTTTPVVTTYKVVTPYFVTINGTVLTRPDGYRGLWTMEDIWCYRPSWQAATNNTPTAAARFSSNKLLLSDPPTAANVSSGNNYIAGTILAPDLSDSNTTSILPVEAHEAICYLAAVYAAEPMLAHEEAIMRVQRYDARALRTLHEIRDENERLISRFGTIQGGEYEDLMFI